MDKLSTLKPNVLMCTYRKKLIKLSAPQTFRDANFLYCSILNHAIYIFLSYVSLSYILMHTTGYRKISCNLPHTII